MIDRDDGNPGSRRVTIFADVGRQRMLRIFAGGSRTVVTTDAVARDIGMVIVGW